MIKTITLLLFTFLFFTSAAVAEDRHKWTGMDTALQTTFIALTVADWQQTREFTGSPDEYPASHETNPLLPDHPSPRQVNLVIGGSIIVHTAVAYFLPRPYRTIWQSFWIGVEAEAVYANYSAGVRLQF